MIFAASFLLAGVIFLYLFKTETNFLSNVFIERSLEEYIIYFGIDIIAEFLILLIVSMTLK